MTRLLKYLLITVGVLAFLVISTALVLTYFFGDQIKTMVVRELNKNLVAEVKVNGGIELSFFKHFPHASVSFNQIAIEGNQKSHPLTTLEELSLIVNIWDIIQKDYHISEVALKNGYVNIIEAANGKSNYIIWRTAEKGDTLHSPEFSLGIDKIQVDNVHLTFTDEHTQFHISALINKGFLSGDFAADKFTLNADLDFKNDSMLISGVSYFNGKDCQLSLVLNVDNINEEYLFENGSLVIQDNSFTVAGLVNDADETTVDFRIINQNGNLREITNLIPMEYSSSFANYKGTGKVSLEARIKGRLTEKYIPAIRIDYALNNGIISIKGYPNQIQHITSQGYFNSEEGTDISRSTFHIESLRGTLNNKPFSLIMKLTDVTDPYLDINLNGNLDLAALNPLIKTGKLNGLRGELVIDKFTYSGSPQNLDPTKTKKIKASGTIDILNAAFEYDKKPIAIAHGSLVFNNQYIEVQDVALSVSESDFKIGGKTENLLAYFSQFNDTRRKPDKQHPLLFDGVIQTRHFDFDNFLALFPSAEEQRTTEPGTNYQKIFNIRGRFTFLIEQLKYKRFEAVDFFGDIVLSPSRMLFKKMDFNSMDGKVTMSADIQFPAAQDIACTMNVNAENINVNKLFYQCNSFGQDVLTEDNLRGKLTTTFIVQMDWIRNEFISNQLYVNSDITIIDGQLLKFKPLETLSSYISVDELRDIRFDKLNNQIEIENEVIRIPLMTIRSNAANLDVSGTHNFDNEVNYKLRVNLNRILSNKFRILKTANRQYDEAGDGQLNLFLTMTGPVDDPIVKYDRQAVKEKMIADLKKEGQELRQALKHQKPAYNPGKEQKQWETEEEIEFIEWDEQE